MRCRVCNKRYIANHIDVGTYRENNCSKECNMKEIIEKIKGWNLEDQFDITERDQVIKKLTSDNSDYAKLKQFHEILSKQKDLSPEIKGIVNDNFWDLF